MFEQRILLVATALFHVKVQDVLASVDCCNRSHNQRISCLIANISEILWCLISY